MTSDEARAERREARREREEARYEAMIAREFPPHWLDPWRERVAASVLAWRWVAYMRPMTIAGDEPVFTLEHSAIYGPTEPVGMRLSLSGLDQGALIEKARALEAGWPL